MRLVTTGIYGRKSARRPLYDTLRRLNLLGNNRLCLDAGDRLSYEGGADTWRDRSGGGYDFYRGTGTGADAADPTHNGVAGRRTKGEYFSYDGGDYFTLAQANPTWLESIHKDNAVFTIVNITYTPTPAAGGWGHLGTHPIGGTGFLLGSQAPTDGGAPTTLRSAFFVFNGASVVIEIATATDAVANAWNFIAISLTEATGAGVFQTNGTQETLTGKTYSSPSAGAASTMAIGNVAGGGATGDDAGCRSGGVMIWDRALSAAELGALYRALQRNWDF